MKLKEYLETRKISKNIFKVIVLTVFVLSLNSPSYAYFTSTIEGEGKEIVLSTSDISIKFEDNEAIKKTGLTPGERIIKKFSVTNKCFSFTYSLPTSSHYFTWVCFFKTYIYTTYWI